MFPITLQSKEQATESLSLLSSYTARQIVVKRWIGLSLVVANCDCVLKFLIIFYAYFFQWYVNPFGYLHFAPVDFQAMRQRKEYALFVGCPDHLKCQHLWPLCVNCHSKSVDIFAIFSMSATVEHIAPVICSGQVIIT